MAEFVYRAIDKSAGKQVRGTLTAYNLQEAEKKLAQTGLYPITLTLKVARRSLRKQRVTRANVLAFTVQLHSLFSSGVPIVRALEEIASNEKNASFRKVVEEIQQRVEQEGSVSAALEAYPKIFPPFYLGAFKAGESGGTIAQVLKDLVGTIEKQMEFDASLKQAMIYPIFVSVLLSGVGVLYVAFILPKILGMVRELGGKLPITTRMLMWISDTFAHYWYLTPIAPIVIVGGFKYLQRSDQGKLLIDTVLLKVPIVGDVIQKAILTKFAHFLALLLNSGYGLLPSLDLVKQTVGNRRCALSIEVTKNRIQGGESLSSAMRGLNFIPFVISMIAVGEKTGMVAGQLEKVSEYYEKEVERTLKKALAMLEPVILVLFGAFAAVIILSTFMPMYASMSGIK